MLRSLVFAYLLLTTKHRGFRFSARQKETMRRNSVATIKRQKQSADGTSLRARDRSQRRQRVVTRGRDALQRPDSGTESSTDVQASGDQASGEAKDPHQAAESAEAEIWESRTEVAVAFSSDGTEVLRKRGDETSVSFDAYELARLKDTVFTHNHPSGLRYPEDDPRREGNSFSSADVFLAIKHDVAEMRAVTPVFAYSLKRPEAGWSPGTLDRVKRSFRRSELEVRNEFMDGISDGTLSLSQAEARHFHEVWSRVARDVGLDYSRARRGST